MSLSSPRWNRCIDNQCEDMVDLGQQDGSEEELLLSDRVLNPPSGLRDLNVWRKNRVPQVLEERKEESLEDTQYFG